MVSSLYKTRFPAGQEIEHREQPVPNGESSSFLKKMQRKDAEKLVDHSQIHRFWVRMWLRRSAIPQRPPATSSHHRC